MPDDATLLEAPGEPADPEAFARSEEDVDCRPVFCFFPVACVLSSPPLEGPLLDGDGDLALFRVPLPLLSDMVESSNDDSSESRSN